MDAYAQAGESWASDDDSGEVVVVEEPSGTDDAASASSATVTIIAVDEAISASADVAAVVDSASGTVVRRLGGLGDYSTVSIRGSSARQVQVFLDGVPLNPDGSQAVNLSELPISAFERVEIYRGGAPAELAAAPIGGVVNLVTGRLPSTASLAYGAHGTGRVVGAGSTLGPVSALRRLRGLPPSAFEDDLLLMAEAFGTRGDFDAFTDSGTLYNQDDDEIVRRQNNDKRQASALARWRLAGERMELSVSDSFLAREEGLPGPITSPTATTRLATWRNLASARVEGHSGMLRVSAMAWQQTRGETLDDREGEIGVGAQWQHYRTATTGLTGHMAWGLRSWLVPSLTLSGRHDGFLQTDLLAQSAEEPRSRLAGSASASASLRAWGDRLLLEPVLQASALDSRRLGGADSENLGGAGASRDLTWAPTPRVGLLIRPWLGDGEPDVDPAWAGLALKANAGRFFRPPDFTELFGDRGGVVGNEELTPERGWQWDAGLRWGLPARWSASGAVDLAFFQSSVVDRILFVQNSQHTSVPVNLGRSWTQGVEAALALDLCGWVDSQSNLTWTLSRNLTPQRDVADMQLPGIPTWEIYQGTSVHWGEHLRLGHSWSYTDGTFLDATNWFLAPPRSLHGAFVRAGVGGLSLELSLLNLLDRTVAWADRNPLSDDDDTLAPGPITDFFGYPLPGRTWLVSLAWTDPHRGDP